MWRAIGDTNRQLRKMDDERRAAWEPIDEILVDDLEQKIDACKRFQARLDASNRRLDELSSLLIRHRISSTSADDLQQQTAVSAVAAHDDVDADDDDTDRDADDLLSSLPNDDDEYVREFNSADSHLKYLQQAAEQRLETLQEALEQFGSGAAAKNEQLVLACECCMFCVKVI